MNSDTIRDVESCLGVAVRRSETVGGGCVHSTWKLEMSNGERHFLKVASGVDAVVLAGEELGLRALQNHIRVPVVRASGLADGTRWLCLEWLDLHPHSAHSFAELGAALARLHSCTGPAHGWKADNHIGRLPQKNHPTSGNWCEFFLSNRIRPQLDWAAERGLSFSESEVCEGVARLLQDHHPQPSLLHGDLWSGNTAALSDGAPVVFDPAPYFGDAETDLAMLELFGGPLPDGFLEAYGTIRSIPPERDRRRAAYDLYHALNHFNHFGNGYLQMVRSCMQALGA